LRRGGGWLCWLPVLLGAFMGSCGQSAKTAPTEWGGPEDGDAQDGDAGDVTADSGTAGASDSGLADTADHTESMDPTYDLTLESLTTEVLWTGAQGAGRLNNFNGKNYHSMSVWRDGHTYVVFVDADLRARVVQIADDGTEVSNTVLTDYEVLEDGHHSFALGMDAEGYLHISGDMHNYPGRNSDHMPAAYRDGKCMYWRSDAPYDIRAFTWLGAGPDGQMPYGDAFSYMAFTNDRDGDLFFHARTRTSYHPDMDNKQVFTLSRYDSTTEAWAALDVTPTSSRRSAVTLLGNDVEHGSGSYTRIHGWVSFDVSNRMHIAANVIEGDAPFANPPHYATHGLYLSADDQGGNTQMADGTPVELPAMAVSEGPQQADVVGFHPDHSLATFTSVATDPEGHPHVLLKRQWRDSAGERTSEQMLLQEWNGESWVDHGDLDGILATGDNSRIVADDAGVMSVAIGHSLVRFFEPGGQLTQTDVGMHLDNLDLSYVMATGGLQALVDDGDELHLVRVHIERPAPE